jgi:predicted type IV restriction endonuclease
MGKTKVKVLKERRTAIYNARKMIKKIFERDANEPETRRRVEEIFKSVLGYNTFKNLTSERVINGPGPADYVDFSIQEKPGDAVKPLALVELKRVRTKLTKKHLKQITSYAFNTGCEWIILTNGRDWQVWHVEFGQPPEPEMLDAWNLIEDKVDELVKKFEILTFKAIKGGELDNRWGRLKALAPDTLLAALISDSSFATIKRNLRKETNTKVTYNDIYKGIRRLLNEAAAVLMSDIKIPIRPKMVKKDKIKKEKTLLNMRGPAQAD